LKICLIWTTPNDLDPNRYLRPIIEKSLRKVGILSVYDSSFQIENIAAMNADFILMIGTLHTLQLQVVDVITSKRDVKLYFWNLEDPYDFDSLRPWESRFDHIFTVEIKSIAYYQNVKASYLPLAGDPDIHFRETQEKRNNRILIVGSDYDRRARISNMLAEKFPNNRIVRVGDFKNRNSNIHYLGRLDNNRIPELDNSFLCTIIIGRDFDFSNREFSIAAGSPGPRLFEALFAGGRVLIDRFSISLESSCPDLIPYVYYFESLELLQQLILDFESSHIFDPSEQTEWLRENHSYDKRIQKILEVFMAGKE